MRPRPLLVALAVLTLALAGCSGSGGPRDSDGDGLPDGKETTGWVITVDLVGKRVSYLVTSDPQRADTDGDGIPDAFEFGIGTDPRHEDTDRDGLTDCQEAFHTVLEDCRNPDFDGIGDGGTGTIATNADSDPGVGRYVNVVLGYLDETGTIRGDVGWGDGIPDGAELAGHDVTLHDGTVVRVTTDPLRKDSDGDGLEDGEEAYQFGTHPALPDTDGDGCLDGRDPVPHAAETYTLHNVTLTHNAGTAPLRVTWSIADNRTVVELPPGTTAPTPADLGSVRPAQCSFNPIAPWLPVEILVEVPEGNGWRLLDLFTHSNPDNAVRVHWNPLDGRFSWRGDGGAAFAAPMAWSGGDGTLQFAPAWFTQGSGQAA